MLAPRLKMISEHINTKTAADIGTDHAYVPIYLAQNKISDFIIASDIKKGPLDIARSNVLKYGLSDKIELRLGAGLEPVGKNEVQSIVIAGMGGEVIKNILEKDKEKAMCAECLILQPMNSQDLLRKWLSDNNFLIFEEDITTEGYKVYNLICAKKGTPVIFKDEFELHLPEYLYNHKNFKYLKEKKLREFKKIKSGLEKAAEKDTVLIKKYEEFIKRTENISERKGMM